MTDPDGRTHRALDMNLPMAPQTSPSISGNGGFWQIAFHGANGDLWFADSSGKVNDFGPQMAGGGSPATVAVSGGYETALAAQNGDLWVVGRDGTNFSLSLHVALGTNPAIAALGFGQTWGAVARATDGTLHLAFPEGPDGAGGIADHATGQAVEDGTSPAATAFSNDPSPEIAFAGPDSMIRLMDPSGNVTQIPASAPGIAGGTSPAYAVDVNGGSGHWQIAWQAKDEHTLWTYGNNFFSSAFGAQTTDWNVVMGPQTSPALPSMVATPVTVCCVVGGF